MFPTPPEASSHQAEMASDAPTAANVAVATSAARGSPVRTLATPRAAPPSRQAQEAAAPTRRGGRARSGAKGTRAMDKDIVEEEEVLAEVGRRRRRKRKRKV